LMVDARIRIGLRRMILLVRVARVSQDLHVDALQARLHAVGVSHKQERDAGGSRDHLKVDQAVAVLKERPVNLLLLVVVLEPLRLGRVRRR
jgi:hypothetical protein